MLAGYHRHPTAGTMESQSVKTTQVPRERGYDGGYKVKGRKRHILVDTMGLLVAVVVTAASVSENEGVRHLLKRMGRTGRTLCCIWINGGYKGTILERDWEQCHIMLSHVLRPEGSKGFVLLAR